MRFKDIRKKKRALILLTMALNIVSAFGMVYAGYSLSFLFRSYEASGDRMQALTKDCAFVALIWLIDLLLYAAEALMEAHTLRTLRNEVRSMISERILASEYAEFTGKDSGHYVSWFTNDLNNISEQSLSSLFSLAGNVATALSSTVALFSLGIYIGTAAVVLFFFVSVLPQLLIKKLQAANERRSKAQEESTESFKDAVMGFPILFLANRGKVFARKIAETSGRLEEAQFQYAKKEVEIRTVILALSVVGQVVMVAVAVLTAILGLGPIGATLAVGNLAGNFFSSVGSVTTQISLMKAGRVLWEKFTLPDTRSEKGAAIGAMADLSIRHLSYAYGEKRIFSIEKMDFRRDGKYAIIGESGSGKTTLVKILLGLLRDYQGSARIGDREIRDIESQSLFKHIAYVDQKVYLFQDSLRFNITLGADCSDTEIMQILKRCKLDSFVRSLPEGLETFIAEDGKNLSGGQRQRIALARALIRKVPFVIVDEGTSALDEMNAREIENDLVRDEKIGVIIITHHLRDDLKAQLDGTVNLG